MLTGLLFQDEASSSPSCALPSSTHRSLRQHKKDFYPRGTDTARNGDAHRHSHTVSVAPTSYFSEITADIIVALRPNEKDLVILGLYHKIIEAVPGLDKQVE